ncbi:MAG TPA: GGDEF domain-containing protein [Solirubrobacteraceae bacterium]|jgi:diguanylate cyclase (GGDEF)-like protein|nr:GGDEF domain-containing protein [Solirubrobacteraceae bacterium]
MDVVTGKDAAASSGGMERLLAGIRRLTALAETALDSEAIYAALADELFASPGAQEVHIHRLGGEGDDLVAVYLPGAHGRLSYLQPASERSPGVGWVASTARSFLAADSQELASSVPRLAATGEMSAALLLPLPGRAVAEAVVVLVRREGPAFEESDVAHAGALVEQAAAALALVRARAEAGTDAVTGAMNHRAMRRRLEEEIGRAMRAEAPLSCLLIDLDDFKLMNDRHGHPAGDAMLRGVTGALVGEFRAFDRVARYGGDEFVVILPNADLAAATAAAARALARLGTVAVEGAIGVSASIGAAQWRSPMSTDELLAACDEALLRAKRQGKGRVTPAHPPLV